ncbi:ComEC/Rec2 family competence protein [Pleurocapsa sp. PCC 7319]|uniref:ComEC/Rec2 family competence protein n=1 Tax=Pleurocapsa sp. PCC 7319 TaxID=118161 RepID=UPI000349AD23|nr:ComEC/Rec2 family competence protein [Pleurocapsa sp. PCC 7319]
MARNNWIILCLAYIVGLLSTNLFAFSSSGFSKTHFLIIALGLIGLAFVQAIALHKLLRISYQVWASAAIIAIMAVVYFQLRIPRPSNNDISYQVIASESELVTVTGRVLTEPRLNNNQRLKFWLEATEIDNQEQVSGKLYVTVPLLQGTGIYPGENLKLKGILYLPQAASNPGGFDFQAYLARQGIFAGLQGLEVIFERHTEPPWGWWKLRRRIVRSHIQGLGSPLGQLVSSMVLGRKAVDLPSDIRDRFIEAGLAHVLAASGFHVSLLLGIILKLTNRFTIKPRLVIGIGTLLIYLGLTGIQASVFRACLMGVAVLLALAMNTKVKPLGSLLLAATIILLFNPLLIGDLGFQLSFLATFGLIVTLPGLQTKLDWLPPTIATLVAVPLAASVWVLPLLGYAFNSVATYSILVNICCTPLIIIISLGGMISAIAALIFPLIGSAIAWLLLYPTKLLITIIHFFTNLPGSTWAVGQISLGALLIIYGLFLLVWLHDRWRNQWLLVFLCILTLIVVPRGYQHFNLTQVTILAAQPEPIIVIQDRGKVILINSGNSKTVKYSLLPFLTQQGINRLDYAIDLNQKSHSESDWLPISDRLTIKHFILNPNLEHQFTPISKKTVIQDLNQAIATKSCQISFDSELSLLKLETATETWLILSQMKRDTKQIEQYIEQSLLNQKPVVLVSSKFATAWLQSQPQIIISSAPPKKVTSQNIGKTKFYDLKKDGAITWTPKHGFETNQELSQSNYIF